MQDLNTIPSVGTFGEVARNANTNFSLLKIAVDLLEHSIEHSRGYFTSASALTTTFPSPVVGDWAIVEVSGTPTIYKCSTRGTWSNSGTQWAGGSVDLTEYAQKAELYNSGYYICETAAATAAKTVSASGYLLKTGGNIRIKMSYANTAANATLNIGGTGAKPLYYNDARASASNTWEAEEVVVVYYDGENFIASNAQGGGGKFATGEAVGSVGIDNAPTSDSNNLVKSGGAYNAIQGVQSELTELARNLSESQTETITANNGLVVIGAGQAMDKTTGELVSNSYYTTYEYDLTQYQHIDALKYWASHGSTVVGLFALFQEDTLLYITTAIGNGTPVNISNYSTATKIRISTYVAQRAAKIEITSHSEPLSYNDIAKAEDVDKITEQLRKEAYAEITESEMTVLGNYAMDSSTGELVPNTSYLCCEYDLTQLDGTPISIKWWANRGSSVVGTFALFNGDTLLYISTANSTSGTTYDVPEIYQNATKVRLSKFTTDARLQVTYYLALTIDAFERVEKNAENASVASDVTAALLDVNIFKVPVYKNYINKNDLLYGKSMSSGSYVNKMTGVFSNKIYLKSGTTVTTSGIKPMSSLDYVYLAFFDNNDTYLGRKNFPLKDNTNNIATFAIPSDFDYSYFRILLRDSSEDYSSAQLELGTEATAYVGEYSETYEFREKDEGTGAIKPTILLTGASFAFDANPWFGRTCSMLGCIGTNKAFSGAVIYNTVTAIKNRTLYTIETLDNYDILAIMHVHNHDVCDETNLMTVADYETKIDADGASSLTRSQAFDYVIKKYQTDCYNQKDNAASKWYQSPYGKPPIIVITTSWHDERTAYNNSVRLLAAKWGLTLVEFDKNIGFSSSGLHPVTGAQQSLLYAADSSGSYGWHPLRAANPDGSTQYVQLRMAAIFAKYVKFLVDTVKGYKV